jgi:hypothetical protein
MRFDCDLVLRENGAESRLEHSFLSEIQPGTFVRLDDRDWIVMEIVERPGKTPEVVCRPANEHF